MKHGAAIAVTGCLLAVCLGLSAQCLEWRALYGGRLATVERGIEIRPTAFRPNWSSATGVGCNVSSDGARTFEIRLGIAELKGGLRLEPHGDEISVEYALEASADLDLAEVSLVSALPLEAEGNWQGSDYCLSIDGNRVFTLEFGDSRPALLLQDNRPWGQRDKSLRIRFGTNGHWRKGEVRRLQFAMKASCGIALGEDSVIRIKQGSDWVPLSACREVLPGTAFDFSEIVGRRTAAGAYGRVVSRGGRFEFLESPGKTCRFYGVNLCESANYPTPAEAPVLADRLARVGYNAVRFHHHDADWERDFARLDALAAACVSNGIYYTTDLYVSRPVRRRDIGLDGDGVIDIQEFKCLLPVHEGAFSNYVSFVRNFLSHTNVVTGCRWADDPALVSLVLVNEGNPGNAGMKPYQDSPQWRKAWGRPFPRDLESKDDPLAREFRRFLAEKECAFFARVRRIVRDELKCQALLSDFNGWTEAAEWRLPRQTVYDYVDDHFYVDHPEFLEGGWSQPSRLGNENPFKMRWLGPEKSSQKRIPGKPLTVSEWHFCGPGKYRGVAGLYTGAEAARAGWSGLWRFTWSHSRDRALCPNESIMTIFDIAADPLSLLSERAGICLYRRGDFTDKRLAIDARSGVFTVAADRTCGGFAESGSFTAGVLQADLGQTPATVFATALDGQPLGASNRILLAHLTELQNEGTAFGDLNQTIFLSAGSLPHLVRNGRAQVKLALSGGLGTVWRLGADGTRVAPVPFGWSADVLSFEARVDYDSRSATMAYEIVREQMKD